MGQTIRQKIHARASGRECVTPGVASVFKKEFGAQAKVWDASRFMMIPDLLVYSADPQANQNIRVMCEFARQQQIKYFYDVGTPQNIPQILRVAGRRQARESRRTVRRLKMKAMISGAVYVLGYHIDTDQILSAEYLKVNPSTPAGCSPWPVPAVGSTLVRHYFAETASAPPAKTNRLPVERLRMRRRRALEKTPDSRRPAQA